jgi:hypothetical protein
MDVSRVFKYKNVYDDKKGFKASFRKAVKTIVKRNKGCATVLVHPLFMDSKAAFKSLAHLKPFEISYGGFKRDLVSALREPGEFVFLFVSRTTLSNKISKWISGQNLKRSFLLIDAKDDLCPSFSWTDHDKWKQVAHMLKKFGVHSIKLAGELLLRDQYSYIYGNITYGGCVAGAGSGLSKNGIKVELLTELSFPNREVKQPENNRRIMELLMNI